MSSGLKMLSVALLAVLPACVTMTPAEQAKACKDTDWKRFGKNDGRLGIGEARRARLFRLCKSAGQPADLKAYREGRDEGLVAYCTPERGYRDGRTGRRYQRVCPKSTEPDFLQGYRAGLAERPRVIVSPFFSFGIGYGWHRHHRRRHCRRC